MSEATVCVTFHKFYQRFAEELYHELVQLPTGTALEKVMEDYYTTSWGSHGRLARLI